MFHIKRKIRKWLGLDRDQLTWYIQEGLKLGKNVHFVDDIPNFGSEPYLVSIGDESFFSYEVAFNTHDASVWTVYSRFSGGGKHPGLFGKITIGKRCFIGARTTILRGVTIGDNCIIGAGSVVNKDIPSNSVAAGVPCKVICTLDEWVKKHEKEFMYINDLSYEEKKEWLIKHYE